jgi:hypothetical protein
MIPIARIPLVLRSRCGQSAPQTWSPSPAAAPTGWQSSAVRCMNTARTGCGRLRAPGHILAAFAWGCLWFPLLAAAQVPIPGERIDLPPPPPAATQQLRERIEARYRIIPIRDGVLLVPREPAVGPSVEVADGTVAIDGRAVTGQEVRERLGPDAEPVLQLSYLDRATREALLRAAPDPEPTVEPVPLERPEPTRRERRMGTRVRFGQSVVVQEDEIITEDVVAILGSVIVRGAVRGDVVAVGGSVTLGPKAQVDGDVTAVGGMVHLDPGAGIRGEISEVTFRLPDVRPRAWHVHREHRVGMAALAVVFTLMRLLLIAVLAALVLLVAPIAVERIGRSAATEPAKAILVGLAAQILFLPLVIFIVVVLSVSIIGIPLLSLVPLLFVLFLIAMLVGFTGVAWRVGGWFRSRASAPGPYTLLAWGVVLLGMLSLAGRIAWVPGGPLTLVALTLSIAGFVVEYVAWTVGLGAVLLTRFGTMPPDAVAVPAAPAPPAPEPGGSAVIRPAEQ